MKIIDCIQGSDEWHQTRLGKVTGTGFSKVLAKGQGKVRKAYLMQLAAERLSGLPQDTYCNAVMDRGNEIEPQARACYEVLNGVSVLQVFMSVRDAVMTATGDSQVPWEVTSLRGDFFFVPPTLPPVENT